MKTAMKKMTLGLSVAALAVGGVACAQQAQHGNPFMDTDGNGVITRAEAQKAAEDMFAKLDVNKDGKIDQTDRDARHAERRAEMFAQIDANHDGSISRQEFTDAKGPGPHGPGAADGDGPPPPPPGMDGDGPPPPGMSGPGMGGPGMGDHGMGDHGMGGHGPRGHDRHGGFGMRGPGHGMMMLGMADTNKDGAVSKAEFMAAATRHFGEMDANNDGKVTQEERQATREKMMAQMKAQRQATPPAQK